MSTHSRSLKGLLALVPLAALLAGACQPDASGPSDVALLAHRQGGGGGSGSGSAGFAVLANAAVSCTGGSITGDVGTFVGPGAPGAITQTSCPITGTTQIGTPASISAYNSFLAAYIALAPQGAECSTVIAGTLAGESFGAGVYCLSSEAKTGVLTLTGNGPWTFKVPNGALTGTNFEVVMAGGNPCNVTWWVDAAATMTTSRFVGNILAGAAITMTGGTFRGNAWAGADGVGDVSFTEGTVVTGCAAPGSSVCRGSEDRATGGGWINGLSAAKATFGVSGSLKDGRFSGNVSFEDRRGAGKNDDVNVKSTSVSAYSAMSATVRRIEGAARFNGQRGFTYRVDVTDNGPGGSDVFAITVWNAAGVSVYSASGTLRGGNITVHPARTQDCRGGDDDDDDDNDDDDNDDDDNDDDDDDDGGNDGDDDDGDDDE